MQLFAVGAIGLLSLVAVGCCNPTANNWADQVFASVKLNAKSIDTIKMNPFNFKIRSTGTFNRDVHANFNAGLMSGFSNIRRSGDCYIGAEGLDTVIGCTVLISPIRTKTSGEVKGDVVTAKLRKLNVKGESLDTSVDLKFRGRPGGVSDVGVSVRSHSIKSQITEAGKFDLSVERMKSFMDALTNGFSNEVRNALTSTFKTGLLDLARNFPMV